MEQEDELKRLLRGMGLNEYESGAYLSLLRYGDLTAEEVNEYGKIPLPRVYDTLRGLCNMGVVVIGHSRPKVYRAVDADAAVKNLINFRRQHIDSILRTLEKDSSLLLKHLKASRSGERKIESNVIWYYKIREDPLGAERRELQEGTKNEYLSFSGDMSWIKRDKESLKRLARKGAILRIIANREKISSANLKLAKMLGIEVRFAKIPLRGEISDGKTSIVVAKHPNGIKTDYEILRTDNPLIINLLREHFMLLWKDAPRK